MRRMLASALPDSTQRLLLAAALKDGAAAVDAWRAWVRACAFDEMDAASQRLIPLLGRNLARLGVEHPDAGRMRGIHRYWWSRNQMLLRKLGEIVAALRAAGIDPLALKGVPLALRYYDDVGLRPMSDVDLLVPTAAADRALAVMEAEGWRINDPVRVFRADRRVDVHAHPGVGLVAADRAECDLHWHVLHDCCWDDADAPFWQHATTVTWQNQPYRVPQATELLLHVIVHGASFNLMPPIRWIADAAQVMRRAPAEIEWDRLVALASRRWLTVVVREALALVAELSGTAAPAEVIERLARVRPSFAERREYERRLVDPHYRYTLLGRWVQLSRQHSDVRPLRRLARVPAFMQQIWAVDRKAILPFTLAFRIVPAYVARVVRGSPAPAA